jgi:hypothetical protein
MTKQITKPARKSITLTWEWEKKHQELRLRKLDRLSGLIALMATYEAMSNPNVAAIHDLRRKIANVRNQLDVMKP